MAFRGWTDEALAFFDGLELDNSKAYWEANKERYLSAVRAPMDALLAELSPEFGPVKVFRPYRDVRFSKDKTPYKTNLAAMVGEGYISFSAAGLGAGTGMYHMAPDQLDRYRRAVDDEATGGDVAALVAKLRKAGFDVIAHGVLKTAPKGYARDHPRIDLLRSKGLTVWREWEPGPWLATKKAKDKVVSVFRGAVPLNQWLAEHVGPSTMEGGWGR
jgi:uncharacterized protein (TIGR02453 family)